MEETKKYSLKELKSDVRWFSANGIDEKEALEHITSWLVRTPTEEVKAFMVAEKL